MSGIQARIHIDRNRFTLKVDLHLPGSGVTALFGPSGSGKTTLLRSIAGLEKSPTGYLCVKGEIWQDANHWLPPHKRPLGYVFQEASLFPHLKVLANMRFGLKRLANLKSQRLDEAISLLGIGDLVGQYPHQLSGGERQRVSIARALALNPRLLLMDEPLAALDVARKQEILPYLERLHNELDIPVIYVSHSPDEIARLADYVVIMDAGQAKAQGPLKEVLARLDLPIRLGEDVSSVLEATVAERDSQWHLARMAFAGGSLWTRDTNLAVGSRVRVRVLARDVSLAQEKPSESSIQNVLHGRIDAIADDDHLGLALVRVQVGEVLLVARLTKRALANLNISIDQPIWVQVKSVALLR